MTNYKGYNEAITWAADWLEGQAASHSVEIKDFAATTAMSIRAHKKPWNVDFSCKVCGIQCDLAPDPPERAVCPEHCEDHDYQVIEGQRVCEHCNAPCPHDFYDE